MSKFVDGEFDGVTLDIDGNIFEGCTFKNCQLRFAGGDGAQFDKCTFDGVGILFVGAAANTLKFMGALYRSGFAPMVEATIAQMKSGVGPENVDAK